MSKTKENLIEVSYLVIGSLLGVVGTVCVKLIIVIPEPPIVIISSAVIAGVLFGLYRILLKLAEGSLIKNILKQLSKFYQ